MNQSDIYHYEQEHTTRLMDRVPHRYNRDYDPAAIRRYWLGHSVRETARRFGVSESTVNRVVGRPLTP